MKKLLILSIIVLMTSPAWATTYYVATTGGGTTCSLASPCSSPQTVFDNKDLAGGDIIEVAAGTYTSPIIWGSNDSGSAGSPVIMRPATGATVIIDGADTETYGIVIGDVSYVTVENITVQNVRRRGIQIDNTGNDPAYDQNVTISGCTIKDVDNEIVADAVGIMFWGQHVTITNCTIYNIGTDGIWGSGKNATITNNYIYNVSTIDTNGDGVQFSVQMDGLIFTGNTIDHSATDTKQAFIVTGLLTTDSAINILSNNTFIGYPNGSTHMTVFIAYPGTAPYLLFQNNTISGGLHGLWISGAGTYRYNLITNPKERAIEVDSGAYPVLIYNNTMDGTTRGTYGIYLEATAADVTIKNNIATNFDTVGYATLAGTTEDHNCGYGNGTNFAQALGAGSIETNPLLTGSYRLSGNSPAKDTGTPIYTYAQMNALSLKIYGTAPDMGAYELVQTLEGPKPPIGGKGNLILASAKAALSTSSAAYVQQNTRTTIGADTRTTIGGDTRITR